MPRLSVHKHGGASPNCEIPTVQPKVNYKEFRAAFKATQERRAKAGKLVLSPPSFGKAK